MKSFIKTIITSLNPSLYTGLSNRSYSRTILYFVLLMVSFSLISMFFFSPSIIKFYASFDDNLDKLTNLDASFTSNTKEEIIVTKNPLIIIDSNRNSTNGEYLLITENKIFKRKLLGYKEINTKNINLSQTLKESKFLIFLFLILSLPTFFLIYTLFNIIKYLILVSIISLIAITIIKILGHNIKFKQIISSGIYAITILIFAKILLIINFKYINLIPVIIYVVWYVLVLILLNDTKVNFKEDLPKMKKLNTHKSKSDSIHLDAEEMQKLKNLTKGK